MNNIVIIQRLWWLTSHPLLLRSTHLFQSALSEDQQDNEEYHKEVDKECDKEDKKEDDENQ